MAGANNKSAKKYGYTQRQIQTERAKGGVLSLASLMSRVDPARPTKAYLARKEDVGNAAPLHRSGISKDAVAQIKARGIRSSPADMAAQEAASARNVTASANMKPETRAKMERIAAQQSRRSALTSSRPAPKVTWGEKVAASRKKAAEAFSVSNLMKRSADDSGRKGADSFSVANLMKRSEGAQSSGPKLPKHVSQVGQGSFAHPKNTVRENRLHWAATKAKETGKQAYVVADTSRHAAQSGGLKLTYKQPKSGKYMAVSPSGAISYHN